jgi:hypothetical protein
VSVDPNGRASRFSPLLDSRLLGTTPNTVSVTLSTLRKIKKKVAIKGSEQADPSA